MIMSKYLTLSRSVCADCSFEQGLERFSHFVHSIRGYWHSLPLMAGKLVDISNAAGQL